MSGNVPWQGSAEHPVIEAKRAIRRKQPCAPLTPKASHITSIGGRTTVTGVAPGGTYQKGGPRLLRGIDLVLDLVNQQKCRGGSWGLPRPQAPKEKRKMHSTTRIMIYSVAAALVAGTGMALSQRITLFHDHQGVTEASRSNTPVVALQTVDDVGHGPTLALARPWTSSMEDFYRTYGAAPVQIHQVVKKVVRAAASRPKPASTRLAGDEYVPARDK